MTAAAARATGEADPAARMSLTATLPAAAKAKLDAYLDLIVKWNRIYNLTAIRDRASMVAHHLDDSLAILPHLPHAAGLRLLDVGSGAGLPGIPLAIARPDWTVVLLDANRKKAAFLTQAAIELSLRNVAVVTARVEDYRPDAAFDVIVARAFSDLASFAQVASRHLAADGIFAAMKGTYPQEEIALLPDSVAVVAAPSLEVPGLQAQRRLIVMRATRASDRPERAR